LGLHKNNDRLAFMISGKGALPGTILDQLRQQRSVEAGKPVLITFPVAVQAYKNNHVSVLGTSRFGMTTDHVDGKKDNDRIENHRACSHVHNNMLRSNGGAGISPNCAKYQYGMPAHKWIVEPKQIDQFIGERRNNVLAFLKEDVQHLTEKERDAVVKKLNPTTANVVERLSNLYNHQLGKKQIKRLRGATKTIKSNPRYGEWGIGITDSMMDSKEGEALKKLGYVKKTYYLDNTQKTVAGAVRRKCKQGLAVFAFFDVHGPAIWPKNQWNELIKPEWDKSIKADLTKRYTVTEEMIKDTVKRIKDNMNKKRKTC
jgi:hypothetical protein